MIKRALTRVARRLGRGSGSDQAPPRSIEGRVFHASDLPLERSVEDVLALLSSDTPPRLVDVRRLEEVRSGIVPGAQLVPEDQMLARSAEFPRDEALILFCEEGSRSDGIVSWLRGEGFSKVQSIDGGLRAWRDAGGELAAPPVSGPDASLELGQAVRVLRVGVVLGGSPLPASSVGAVQWIQATPEGTRFSVAIDDANGRWNLLEGLAPEELERA